MSAPRDRRGLSGIALTCACLLACLLALFSPAAATPAPSPLAQAFRPPGSLPGDGGPSRAIFPPQILGIRFNHQRHVLELGMSCTTCHEKARTSRNAADSLLPPATRCDGCHGSDHRGTPVSAGDSAIGACAYCHTGYREGDGTRVALQDIPPPNLRFDHAVHATRGIGCARCHGAVERTTLATADQLPRMRGCFDCHVSELKRPGVPSRACTTCHLAERGTLLKTQFASGELLPPAWLRDSEHGPDWIERHKHVAGNDSRFCANCHTERSCSACHDGQVRPRRVHPNDFLSMHSVAARQNQPACTSCHQQQSFCLSCHQRSGVTLTAPLATKRGRFHPPQSLWTDGARGPGHHAWEAQRNLNACVSCHVERDCTTCHATAAVGGRGLASPHPAGFAGRCGRALRQNPRPCLVCHDESDPNLARCR
jgi:hypothetical protein